MSALLKYSFKSTSLNSGYGKLKRPTSYMEIATNRAWKCGRQPNPVGKGQSAEPGHTDNP